MHAEIAVLPGDGIGPEVVTAALSVLRTVARRYGHTFEFGEYDIGGIAIDKTGEPLPAGTLEACRKADAVLLGAVGGPKWSDPNAKVRPEQGLLALRKGLGLISYLADARAPVGRDHMASLLWPEADVEAARSRLRRTLHKIRVAFTVDVIEADRTSIALAPSIEARIDAHAFEAACVAGELNEALRLYAGDFLQGLSIEGCAAFEEWAFFRREAEPVAP